MMSGSIERKEGLQNCWALKRFCFSFFLGPAGRDSVKGLFYDMKDRDVIGKEF